MCAILWQLSTLHMGMIYWYMACKKDIVIGPITFPKARNSRRPWPRFVSVFYGNALRIPFRWRHKLLHPLDINSSSFDPKMFRLGRLSSESKKFSYFQGLIMFLPIDLHFRVHKSYLCILDSCNCMTSSLLVDVKL